VLATNRYYDPTEGRWLTRDPIGYAGGLNLYGYCSGNPVNLVDPLGLCGEQGGDDGWSIWDIIQTGLDIGGSIPGIGEPLDLINGGISLMRGDYVNAGLSFVSMVPIAGDIIGKGGKIGGAVVSAGSKVINKGRDYWNGLGNAGFVSWGRRVDDFSNASTINSSLKFNNMQEAGDYAMKHIGGDPVQVSTGKVRSSDGRWQFRGKPNDISGAHGGGSHMHLEELNPVTGQVINNQHLYY
jgi:uncharacterized protein RhaS with RHS repeats